jgi:hypothetical protein
MNMMKYRNSLEGHPRSISLAVHRLYSVAARCLGSKGLGNEPWSFSTPYTSKNIQIYKTYILTCMRTYRHVDAVEGHADATLQLQVCTLPSHPFCHGIPTL